jgi:hypothetical protein
MVNRKTVRIAMEKEWCRKVIHGSLAQNVRGQEKNSENIVETTNLGRYWPP